MHKPRYLILSAPDTAALELLVHEYLRQGAVAIGGPFIVSGNHILSGSLAQYGGIAQAIITNMTNTPAEPKFVDPLPAPAARKKRGAAE
jgi:hypothetical protein